MNFETNLSELNESAKNRAFDKKSFDSDKRVETVDKSEVSGKATNSFDPDKRIEKEPIQGGRYSDVRRANDSEGKEVHHMPADSASFLETKDGPTIIMDKEDHEKTASWGNSKEARAYCAKQKEYIEAGKFREAFDMDVKDIQNKFGDKYDSAIEQARAYLDKLEKEGKI